MGLLDELRKKFDQGQSIVDNYNKTALESEMRGISARVRQAQDAMRHKQRMENELSNRRNTLDLRSALEQQRRAEGGMSGNPQRFSTAPVNRGVERLRNEQARRDAISMIGTPLSQGTVRAPENRNLNRPAPNPWGEMAMQGLAGSISGAVGAGMEDDARLAELQKQIQEILSQPDIPGQWISPYSDEYLNQLGNRLAEQGSISAQQFEAAKGDIVANYAQGEDQRNKANSDFFGGLANNLANLGMNYSQTVPGQQAASDASYLSQMAAANQASGTSFMDKLGELAKLSGDNLGMQAREGLLTPKQWVGPQSGISAGEQAMVDFLSDQYFTLLDQKGSKQSDTDMMDSLLKLTQTADEDMKQLYPDVVQGMSNVTDTRLRDELDRIWSLTGDPAEALKYVVENYSPEEGPRAPTGRPSSNPGAINAYRAMLNRYRQEKELFDRQAAMYPALLDFFKQYSPTYTGAVTQRTMGNSSRVTTP